jgi:hypothetical protein
VAGTLISTTSTLRDNAAVFMETLLSGGWTVAPVEIGIKSVDETTAGMR